MAPMPQIMENGIYTLLGIKLTQHMYIDVINVGTVGSQTPCIIKIDFLYYINIEGEEKNESSKTLFQM